uniref:Myocardin n=1 Tax=Nothobranchius pienaari TaxID=704102 RepID=A0A1A8LG74_9TELE
MVAMPTLNAPSVFYQPDLKTSVTSDHIPAGSAIVLVATNKKMKRQ